MIEVVAPGPLTTIQDLGRPGHAALGAGRSGAADRHALRAANRLAGNDEGAAALEVTLGGLRLRFGEPALVALAGAPCRVRLTASAAGGGAAREPAMREAVQVAAGDELRLGAPRTGVRTYLAVAGGIDVEPVLGSRSTDTLAGIGPPPLRAGDRLAVGSPRTASPLAGEARRASPDAPPPSSEAPPPRDRPGEPVLRILPGPRADWFTDAALAALCDAAWTVTPDSSRAGLRLDGPPLERARDGELEPEGMVEGALQVPPDGRPVLFLADHPVTGGYPVIAVVATDDVPLAAQARPGTTLRFARG